MTGWVGPSALDRLPGERTEAALDALWEGARVVPVDASGQYPGRDGAPLPLESPGRRQPDDILLGRAEGTVWFARPLLEVAGPTLSWRDVGARHEAVAAAAVGLGRWHAANPPCEECGGATRPAGGGSHRGCVDCGALVFPRQDPAVIVAVTDTRDRLLLARQASWTRGRVSLLAGFVEMGESAEQACRREVAEEVGIELADLHYVSSQPWPMPRSLMLGFRGVAEPGEPRPDGSEISAARYWTRGELSGALAAGEVGLPGRASIARALIDAWLQGS